MVITSELTLVDMLDGIPGWMSKRETEWLNEQAAEIEQGVIVEIGSYCGRSTMSLARDATVPVYAIDPHLGEIEGHGVRAYPKAREQLLRNISTFGLGDRVRVVDLPSDIVAPGWNETIGFLLVDGDHSGNQPIRDVDNWYPYLVVGGIIAVHDKSYKDVKRALARLDDDPTAQQIPACGSLQAYCKVSLTPANVTTGVITWPYR